MAKPLSVILLSVVPGTITTDSRLISWNNPSSGIISIAKNQRPLVQVSSSTVKIEEQRVEGLFTIFSPFSASSPSSLSSSSQSWKS